MIRLVTAIVNDCVHFSSIARVKRRELTVDAFRRLARSGEDERAKASRELKAKAETDHSRAADLDDLISKRIHVRADVVRISSLWQHIRGHAVIDEFNLHRWHLLP